MAISELNFASQALTEKGRNYKFDDLKCLLQYQHDNPEQPFRTVYISTYDQKGEWVDAEQGWFMHSPEFKSPMGGNWLAFMTQQGGREQSETLPLYRWQEVLLSMP